MTQLMSDRVSGVAITHEGIVSNAPRDLDNELRAVVRREAGIIWELCIWDDLQPEWLFTSHGPDFGEFLENERVDPGGVSQSQKGAELLRVVADLGIAQWIYREIVIRHH